MDAKKRKQLVAAGYQITDSAGWLGLTPQEETIVNMRVNLALEIERVRKAANMTQQALADKIGTQQSGVARMLKNPTTATIDSLIRTLLILGTSPKRIAALF